MCPVVRNKAKDDKDFDNMRVKYKEELWTNVKEILKLFGLNESALDELKD
jgi:hypothetical protein